MPSIYDDILSDAKPSKSQSIYSDLLEETVPLDTPSRFEDRPQRPLTLEDYNVTGPSRRPSSVAAPVTDDSHLRASEASDVGFETPTPEDIAEGEAQSDYLYRERLNKNIRQASPFTMAQKLVVEPLRDVGAYTGNIGKGIATDIIQGNQDASAYPLGNTRRAFLGQIPEEQQGAGGRILQSAGQGAGAMAPALAAQAVGVPAPLAFGSTMAAEPLARGDIPGALIHGTLGAVLPGASSMGAQLGERTALNLAGRAALPEALAGPAQVAGKILGSQTAMDALAIAASSPELIEEFKKDPERARMQLAEIVGANLAFEGAHLPANIRQAAARNAVDTFMGSPEYKRAIDRGAFEGAQVRQGKSLTLTDYEQARQARTIPQDVVKPVEPTPEAAAPVEAPKDLQLTPVIKAGGKLWRGLSHAEAMKEITASGDVNAIMDAMNESNKGFVDESAPVDFVTRKEAAPKFLESVGLAEKDLYIPEKGLSSEDLHSSGKMGHFDEAYAKAKAPVEAPKPAEAPKATEPAAPAKDVPTEGKIASVDDAGNVKVYKKSGRFFTQVSLEQAKAQGIPVPEKVPASRAEWIEGMGEAEHQRLFGKPKEQNAIQVEPTEEVGTQPSRDESVGRPSESQGVGRSLEGQEAPAASPAEAQSDVRLTPSKYGSAGEAYDAARADFGKASKEFTSVRDKYRSKAIGDEEFLAARKRFDQAKDDYDAAEQSFIDSQNNPPATRSSSPALEVDLFPKAQGEPPALERTRRQIERAEQDVKDAFEAWDEATETEQRSSLEREMDAAESRLKDLRKKAKSLEGREIAAQGGPIPKDAEQLLIQRTSDDKVMLRDAKGFTIGTFETAAKAAKAANDLGYRISPSSPIKPSGEPLVPADAQRVSRISVSDGKKRRFIKIKGQWFKEVGGKPSGKAIDPKVSLVDSLEKELQERQPPASATLAEPPPIDPNAGKMYSGLGIVPPGFASTKAIADAIQKVPAEFQAFRDNLAGKSAPRTSRASQESGNKLVQFAASKIAAPEVARSMATQVLGPHHKDAAFGQKLGAVLVEDRLRAIHDAFTRAGDATSAAAVETVIGKPWSPFATEADFQAALADPAITAAIERHKATVQPEAQEAHEMARGELSGPGLNTGAFVNLKAIGANIADQVGGGAARGNLENPLRRISKFFKQAKGNAAQYEIDYRTLAERMVEGNFQEAAKRRMYDQLVNDGLAVIADPGDPVPVIGKDKPIRFTIERRGTPMGENRARTYIQNLWVRKDIAPELRQALDVDGAVGKAGLTTAAEIINRIQLAGPTDAVWHTANMLGSIAGSQGGKNVLVDVARKLPGVNLFDAIGRVAKSGMEVMRDSPEIQQQLAELAKIGALRGKESGGWAGRAINFVDKAGRLVRDDMYKNLVERGLVKDSEATRREWVNQMGQYNPRLMGQFQRFFRESGFSPFVVAGRNFNRMAMRRLALSPGIEAVSPVAAAKLRAVEAVGLFTTLVVVPSLINYMLTGNPNGRPGTKFGQIDTGKDDGEGKNVVIDPAQWTGLRRGLRISGVGAAIEGIRHHEGGKRITKDVSRDILGGILHPWTGPAPRTAAVGTTGYDPSFYRQSVDPGDVGENLKAALHELNPAIGAAMEANKKDTAPAKELGYQLGGAVGLKRVPPYTEPRQLADKAREWLRNNKFKLALDEPGYGTDYTRLRQAVRDGKEKTALELMENLRYGKGELGGRSDATIAKAMQAYAKAPFTGSKEKERAFYDSLSEKDQALYDKAMEAKAAEFEKFIELFEKRPERREME